MTKDDLEALSFSDEDTSPASLDLSMDNSEEGGMTANQSIPTATSLSSEDESSSPDSVARFHNTGDGSGDSSFLSASPSAVRILRTCHHAEFQRIKELEQKRLALRHQRFSLEQRLYEFCSNNAFSSDPSPPSKPFRHVLDFTWKCKTTGIRVIYSGPTNEHNEPNGTDGILKFADGQVYRGDIRSGLREGNGMNSWKDGQDYTGEWQENSRNGRGTHRWPDGRKVTGVWKDGHLNGKVYFSWPNGATFDGTCRMGKKQGRGLHTWKDGKVYSGNFENGKEHGFGTLTCPDNVKYRGQFQNGVKHGYGIQLWKTRTYDGEWYEFCVYALQLVRIVMTIVHCVLTMTLFISSLAGPKTNPMGKDASSGRMVQPTLVNSPKASTMDLASMYGQVERSLLDDGSME
jgi:hypothetical protein